MATLKFGRASLSRIVTVATAGVPTTPTPPVRFKVNVRSTFVTVSASMIATRKFVLSWPSAKVNTLLTAAKCVPASAVPAVVTFVTVRLPVRPPNRSIVISTDGPFSETV